MSGTDHDIPRSEEPRPRSGSATTGSLPALSLTVESPRDHLRRVVNVIVPLILMALMLFSAVPEAELPEALHGAHERLIARMRTVSLSQRWSMYAPNPTRGHHYVELTAIDADGTRRPLEETERAAAGWGTHWAWTKDRKDIWGHSIGRRFDKVDNNRVWYMRGVCVREARAGHDVARIEVTRVYRAVRPPDEVREGGLSVLGPERREKGPDASCRVRIIKEMIETDRARREGGKG